MARCGIKIEEEAMATLLKVDGSEMEIAPCDPEQGLVARELFSLVGSTVRVISLNSQSVMVVRDGASPAIRNYRATKMLQFFSNDPRDEVRGSALLVARTEMRLERWASIPFGIVDGGRP